MAQEPFAGVYVYDKIGENTVFTISGIQLYSYVTVGDVLNDATVIAAGVTALAVTIGGNELNSSDNLRDLYTSHGEIGGMLFLYDVTPVAVHTMKGLVYNGVSYEFGVPEPVIPVIDFLLVGGGGGGGGHKIMGGGGGGAGGLIYCEGFCLSENMCVIIGQGGCRGSCTGATATNGGDSCFGSIIAYGGGRGATPNMQTPDTGGSGGAGSRGSTYAAGCVGCTGQGNNGGNGGGSSGGGGGGAGTAGCSTSGNYGGNGGDGLCFDINGELCWYAGGGGGGGCCRASQQGYGGQGGGGNGFGCDATYYGGGGGGGAYCNTDYGGNGCQGIFIARYPSSCGYNITGGTKYECNGYCIHCFTQDGTLIVN